MVFLLLLSGWWWLLLLLLRLLAVTKQTQPPGVLLTGEFPVQLFLLLLLFFSLVHFYNIVIPVQHRINLGTSLLLWR